MDKLAELFPSGMDVVEENTIHADELEAYGKSMSSAEDNTDTSNGNWAMEVNAAIDMYSLKNLLYNDQWVYILCNTLARKISNQVMSVHKRSIKKGKLTDTPWPFHALNEQLESPNKWESYANWMYRIATELVLMGNCVLWKLKFHEQVIMLPTESITIDFAPDGSIESYSVNYGNYNEGEPYLKSAMKILPEDIIHIRLPNQNSMLWGLSPFIPGSRSILFDRYSQEYLLNFYLKQANPGTVMEIGTEANEKQAVRFLKSMELRWTGRASQRRTMILPKGVQAKNLGHTMAEQQLKVHVDDNRETIRALIAMPPHMFGTQKTGSIGSDDTEKQMRNFWETTVIPHQNLISGAFTLAYKRELGKRYRMKFDNSDVPALQSNKKEITEIAEKMLLTHTLNEVRADLYDDEPLEGGDATPKGNQPSSFGAPNMRGMPLGLQAGEIQELGVTPNSKRLRFFLQTHAAWYDKYKSKASGEGGELRDQENKYLERVLGIFLKFAPKAINAFRKVYSNKAIAEVLVKEIYRSKDNRTELEKLLNQAWKQFDLDYKKDLAPILINSGDSGYDLSLDVPFDIPNEEERAVLREENEEGRKEFLTARGLESFQNIQQTTTNQLLDIVSKGTQESKTLQQIANDIAAYAKEITPGRARTIARTEVLTASSLGQKAALDDAAESIPGMEKMWITAGDSRVRDSHISLDGDKVPAHKEFSNGLDFPRDPSGKAGDVINCRCTLIMIPPDADLDEGNISFTGEQRNPTDD